MSRVYYGYHSDYPDELNFFHERCWKCKEVDEEVLARKVGAAAVGAKVTEGKNCKACGNPLHVSAE